MGTHPYVTLHDILDKDPSLVGNAVATKFDSGSANLPLLFKEIKGFLETVPEFRSVVPEQAAKAFIDGVIDEPQTEQEEAVNKLYLQKLFQGVMTAPDATIKDAAAKLVARVQNESGSFPGCYGDDALADLLLRLNVQFPLDIGPFTGEAIYLKAKDPHAYISGDIIECMAASDNVVRVGFTPKFKDVKNLVEMLTYECAPVEGQKMKPASFARSTGDGLVYLNDPPIQNSRAKRKTIQGLGGASVVVVTEGKGTIGIKGGKTMAAEPGFVFFVGAGTDIEYVGIENKLVTCAAFCEV
ncbi:RmlC-like cupin domain-containing protein [Lipomyces orientalis]|uniref:RmlC-like cupin domain-containing protein n=1 Tax=Lipomyces orientalis TaxID=1233043 RepID=A0ACC3TEB2_9ASCO